MLKGTLEELKHRVEFLEREDLSFDEHTKINARRALEKRRAEVEEYAKKLKELAGTPKFYITLAIIITDLLHAVAIAQHDAEVAGADTAHGRVPQ